MPPGCARLARSPRRSSRSAGSTGVTSRLGSDQRRRGVGVSEISRVGVIGSGLMGSGIAEVCARAGLDVLVTRSEEHTSELQSQSNLVCRLLLENEICPAVARCHAYDPLRHPIVYAVPQSVPVLAPPSSRLRVPSVHSVSTSLRRAICPAPAVPS